MEKNIKFNCSGCNHSEVCRYTKYPDEIMQNADLSKDAPFVLGLECKYYQVRGNKE